MAPTGSISVDTGSNGTASVSGLENGGFVVTWADGSGVYYRMYDANFQPDGGPVTVSSSVHGSALPTVATLSDGGFAISWVNGSETISVQRYEEDGSSAGSPSTIQAPGGISNREPEIAAKAGGGYIVTWRGPEFANDTTGEVYMQRFNSDDTTLGSVTLVSPAGNPSNTALDIASFENGGYAVAYTQDYSIYLQRYNNDGTTNGGAILVNPNYDQIIASQVDLVATASGDMVVSWSGSDGSNTGVLSRKFAADGSALSSEYLLASDSYWPNVQSIRAAVVEDEKIIWTFETSNGLECTRVPFDTDGNNWGGFPGTNRVINALNGDSNFATLADGNVVLVWTNSGEVVAQGVASYGGTTSAMEIFNGTAGDDTVNVSGSSPAIGFGDAGNDLIIGGNGPDRLVGAAGNDTLSGGGNADILSGGDGDDVIYGTLSQDVIDGGAGNDILYVTDTVLSGSYEGVELIISLTSGDTLYGGGITGTQGPDALTGTPDADIILAFGGADTVSALAGDDLVEAGDGDDLVFGGDGADTLSGGSGNDQLHGGGGADLLSGGAGIDAASYQDDTIGVSVNLGTGLGSGGLAAGDTLVGIENVFSGTGDDTLIGDAGANYLYTSGGTDILSGGGGADTLQSDGGTVSLDGGDGDDVIELFSNVAGVASGGAGNDELVAGFGSTTTGLVLDGGSGNDTVISVASGDVTLRGDDGNDDLASGSGNDVLSGGTGADTLSSGGGDDVIYGTLAEDLLDGGDGYDIAYVTDTVLSGNYSNIELIRTLGGDVLFGGIASGGADTLVGTLGSDTLSALGGDDQVSGLSGDDVIYGMLGSDLLSGGDGNDFLRGDGPASGSTSLDGDDTILGGAGNDSVGANGGNDLISGGSGDDQLYGADGDDSIHGGADADGLYGGNGNDLLSGGAGIDQLYGGTGIDVLDGGDGDDSLYGEAGGDSLLGGDGDDFIRGDGPASGSTTSDGDDTIDGGAGNDLIGGNGGHDLIQGGTGADSLYGSAGNDTLDGGLGDDYLAGGSGADVLVIHGGEGNDTIGGFAAGSDQIDLDFVFADQAALDAATSQVGNDTEIDLGGGQTVTLLGVSASSLDLGDFV